MADITKKFWNSQGLGVDAVVCTPHATEKREFDLLYIGNVDDDPDSYGNLTVRLRDSDTDVTFYNILPGEFPYSVQYVRAAGTTCTNILGINKDKG